MHFFGIFMIMVCTHHHSRHLIVPDTKIIVMFHHTVSMEECIELFCAKYHYNIPQNYYLYDKNTDGICR